MSNFSQYQPGDIFQINPNFSGNRAFAGCFLVATEIKAWGVMGYVQALGESRAERGGQAFIRIEWENIEPVGRAAWMIA